MPITRDVRAPAVAGSFYPQSAETLRRTVGDLLGAARTAERPARRAVIAPHAGYVYSGAVAAEAFAGVGSSSGRLSRAVVIGPAHFVPFRGIAAPSHAAFATPLGEMPVDVAAVEALRRAGLVTIADEPHAPDHAIEVELPFLQAVFGSLPIVPLLFGSTSADAVAAVIARLWRDDTLLVISSDLSHFEGYEAACRHDARTAAAIERREEWAIGPAEACGHLAIRAAVLEAARTGLEVERLALCNSGDTGGDRTSVVGYGAWAFRADQAP